MNKYVYEYYKKYDVVGIIIFLLSILITNLFSFGAPILFGFFYVRILR